MDGIEVVVSVGMNEVATADEVFGRTTADEVVGRTTTGGLGMFCTATLVNEINN